MAVIFSANVVASVPVDNVVTLTFTDTSTGVTGLVSRTLIIYNSNSQVVDTINMGATLTATYETSADGYYKFEETIVDNSGTTIGFVNGVYTSFYEFLFPQLVAGIQNDCDTTGQIFNLTRAELYKNASITFGLYGQGVNSQSCITQANFYLQTPYYA